MPRLYAVVDTSGWPVVEWVSTRANAERFLAKVAGDDAELAAPLEVALLRSRCRGTDGSLSGRAG